MAGREAVVRGFCELEVVLSRTGIWAWESGSLRMVLTMSSTREELAQQSVRDQIPQETRTRASRAICNALRKREREREQRARNEDGTEVDAAVLLSDDVGWVDEGSVLAHGDMQQVGGVWRQWACGVCLEGKRTQKTEQTEGSNGWARI